MHVVSMDAEVTAVIEKNRKYSSRAAARLGA